MTTDEQVVCPNRDCKRKTMLTAAGRLRRHNEGGAGGPRQCPASGMLPHIFDIFAANTSSEVVPVDVVPPLSGVDELAAWWRETAQAEIDMVVGKAIEYGATDLRDLGYQILEMAGQRKRQVLDAEATEIGIVFYAAGKLARIVAAVKEGRRPAFDSWLDLGIYARMAQRVHACGGWPAVQHRESR